MPPVLPDYPAHLSYLAPARPRSELWRTMLGAMLILAVYFGAMQVLVGYYLRTYGQFIGEVLFARMTMGTTPAAMLTLLFSFVGMALGPVLAVRVLHGRSPRTLLGAPLAAAGRDFLRVATVLLLFDLVLLTLSAASIDRNAAVPALQFVALLPLALMGVLVQSGAEELVFRGYLQQQLAARFASPLVWMTVPAALFAVGHYDPSTWGANSIDVLMWTAVFGVLAADLTARTGTLGAAIAFHFANNISAMVLVSVRGQMDGLALWTIPIDPADAQTRLLMLIDLMAMICAWLLARLALRV